MYIQDFMSLHYSRFQNDSRLHKKHVQVGWLADADATSKKRGTTHAE